ncbi:thioredoxin domain-containing protein [Bacillus aquiflavi]|uniref:Thioredoxin domain-containing protein n=1 Tax=Bacillus aquiflavi TaxID=2672567 RepID=A0A6B3W3I4_9BACI|nr:thioredoxin domain-containing protein [Bacillus aquiflavi]MBA4537146.1 thioredoxin domain-containing protein [Bacillus aquiflavi]NEY82421.1 thioredoxin domain-containing protein [Bacillus aquiflavi]UAC49770.1 thioredoxin domain-containing protein [Bacillus aquiflavi]
MSTNKKPNRLIAEKSPYLLQHAYNPVEWYPWGQEAFEKAKAENKPIFLSIGYSTCHWCHVMERESFEDEAVAKLINERFVSIKVDREERPDIDSVYMNVCQMLTGQGGWPLNVFLTPDLKPFYAGTYFPKESRYGRPGIVDAITQLSDKYHHERERIDSVAGQITESLQQAAKRTGTKKLSARILHKTYEQLSNSFDSIYGGFGGAPKFPIPHHLMYLLRYYKWTDAELALKMVEKTLDSMANGGIYDHVGFGFARYSTDQMWLVPHFEKMLYDNALLLYVYSEAYQVTKKDTYEKIVAEIIQFIKKEMTDQHTAFYSALDADSEGIEGKYYVWSKQEVISILGEQLGPYYCDLYDITENGNFEGKNIPNLIHTNVLSVSEKYGFTVEEGKQQLEKARQRLFEERSKRARPHLDDKVLTSWNALMIAGLTKAAKVFNKEEYRQLAEKAFSFIENTMFRHDRLMARYREGEVKYEAYLDDYAFLLWAAIELYELTFEVHYLQTALRLAERMKDSFWDDEKGGFFFTSKEAKAVLVREKQIADGALPSGNSVAAVQLIKLSHLTGEMKWREMTEKMLTTFEQDVSSYGASFTYFLQSILLMEMGLKEVVILGNNPDVMEMLTTVRKQFLPETIVLNTDDPKRLEHVSPFAGQYEKIAETTIYICENFACQQPLTDINKALEVIIETPNQNA